MTDSAKEPLTNPNSKNLSAFSKVPIENSWTDPLS